MADHQDARRVFDAARLRVTIEFPYLSQGVWSLRGPVLVPGFLAQAGGAIGVDKGWRVYLDPELEWTVAQLATALRHEVWHCLRDHATRRQQRCPERWNCAGDLEINSDMQCERPAPEWPYEGLHPEKLHLDEHLLAEEYYALLPQAQKQDASKCDGSQPDASSPSAAGTSAECAGCGRCSGRGHGGSNSDGITRIWEQGADGSLREVTGVEADAIRQAIAEEIRNQASKSRGTIPAGIARWADSRLTPAKVPWQQVLRGTIRASIARRAGMVDYTRQRPSRRQAASRSKVLLPSLVRPNPKVATVIDTSGSMSEEQLHMAICETQGVIKQSGAEEVAVLSCDASASLPQQVHSVKAVKLVGGGGTDMGVGLLGCEILRPRPDVVAVLTDGFTPWPDESPPFRVVICLLGQHAAPETCPKWAKVVEVNE